MRLLFTVLEVIVLLAIGAGVGFGANRLRGDDTRIDLHYAYARPPAAPSASKNSEDISAQKSPSPDADEPYHFQHEFTSITMEEINDLLGEPDTGAYLSTVIVDARNDDHYEEGHIPGAMHFDRYRPVKFLPLAEDYLANATKIVVYCNGGTCEDSVELCRALEFELGIPREYLFLYENGWDEWSELGMPFEEGPADEEASSSSSETDDG